MRVAQFENKIKQKKNIITKGTDQRGNSFDVYSLFDYNGPMLDLKQARRFTRNKVNSLIAQGTIVCHIDNNHKLKVNDTFVRCDFEHGGDRDRIMMCQVLCVECTEEAYKTVTHRVLPTYLVQYLLHRAEDIEDAVNNPEKYWDMGYLVDMWSERIEHGADAAIATLTSTCMRLDKTVESLANRKPLDRIAALLCAIGKLQYKSIIESLNVFCALFLIPPFFPPIKVTKNIFKSILFH